MGWLWALWLLSQPPERGGLGFDPISARRLTIEAVLFYLGSEDSTKRRCAEETLRSEKPDESKKTRAEKLREEMLKRRLHFTGSAEM